ncbi:hypothetical protein [Lautropia mirabilis]
MSLLSTTDLPKGYVMGSTMRPVPPSMPYIPRLIVVVLYMCSALPQMLPGSVLSWIGGGISDPGESNAVQSVRSQMVGSTGQRVFNPLRRPKKKKDVGKPGGPDEASDGSNPNSTGNQTLQDGQRTAPGNGMNTRS